MVDSNDPLEQSLRSKLLELSQALLDSKERSVAIERALTEEQRLRGEGEVRLRECESVIQELQGQIEVNKQTMEGGQRSGTACVRVLGWRACAGGEPWKHGTGLLKRGTCLFLRHAPNTLEHGRVLSYTDRAEARSSDLCKACRRL